MELFFKFMEYIDVVINVFNDPGDQGTLTQNQREEMVKNRRKDSRALMYIFGAIDLVVYEKTAHVSTSKEEWDVLRGQTHRGTHGVRPPHGSQKKRMWRFEATPSLAGVRL
ncbi:unnamed protein product [Prunus armeniaca]